MKSSIWSGRIELELSCSFPRRAMVDAEPSASGYLIDKDVDTGGSCYVSVHSPLSLHQVTTLRNPACSYCKLL